MSNQPRQSSLNSRYNRSRHLSRLLLISAFALVGLTAVALPSLEASNARQSSYVIGTGKERCVLKAKADCRRVKQKWTVEHHGNLRKVNFTQAKLHGADFRGAKLKKAILKSAVLKYADLRGANLKKAKLGAAKTKKRPGTPVLLGIPSCIGHDIQQETTGCEGADLRGANLNGADLTLSDLSGANLSGANLSGANLSDANLIAAYLYGANLSGANLSGADLQSANLSGANLSGAICNYFNVWPDGTTDHGTTCPPAN